MKMSGLRRLFFYFLSKRLYYKYISLENSIAFYNNFLCKLFQVLDAFSWLKQNNELYSNLQDQSDNWPSQCEKDDKQLWNHMTSINSQDNDNQNQNTSSCDEIVSDTDSSKSGELIDIDHNTGYDSPVEDTCIQPTDPAIDISY